MKNVNSLFAIYTVSYITGIIDRLIGQFDTSKKVTTLYEAKRELGLMMGLKSSFQNIFFEANEIGATKEANRCREWYMICDETQACLEFMIKMYEEEGIEIAWLDKNIEIRYYKTRDDFQTYAVCLQN